MPRTPAEIRELAKNSGVKIVDLRFIDLRLVGHAGGFRHRPQRGLAARPA